MTSIYGPATGRTGGSAFGPSSDLLRQQQLNLNMELVLGANPWLVDDLPTLTNLAMSGADPEQLVNNAGAIAGMQSLDGLANALGNMSDVGQRSAYSKLTVQQQKGLNAIGFEPKQPSKGFLDDTFLEKGWDATAWVADQATKPLQHTVAPVLGQAFNALIWASDVPAHFYRAIRQMEGWQQALALGVGVGAIALTGGLALGGAAAFGAVGAAAGTALSGGGLGTLAALGAAGGITLGGAILGTAPTLISNPSEWADLMNPWGTTGVRRGERIFTKASQERSREILGGQDHIDALARDISANLDVADLAQEFAGRMDSTNNNVMTSAIEKVANGMADPGTQEFTQIFDALAQLVELPEFREAVQTLQDGKISFGRDIAQTFGMAPGDTGYGLVSGSLDAMWLLTMDPTMAVGKAGKLLRMGRRGFKFDGSTTAVDRFTAIVENDKGVRAVIDQVVDSVATNNFELMPKAWRGTFDHMQAWRRATVAAGGAGEFTNESFYRYLGDGAGISQLMQGKGTIQGLEQVILSNVNRSRGWGRMMNDVRRFQQGMTDEVFEASLRRSAKQHGVGNELESAFRSDWRDIPIETSLQWVDRAGPAETAKKLKEIPLGVNSYDAGRAAGMTLAVVPGGRTVGRLISHISTMTPSSKVLRMAGEGSEVDIPRFIETAGRMFSMRSGVRTEWLNRVMTSGTIGQRRQVMFSFVDDLFTVGGLRSTDEGRALADEFVHKYKQIYAFGGGDTVNVGDIERIAGWMPEHHQALELVMPNLRDMADITRHGVMIKDIARIVDSPMLSGAMTRFIKPGWLLRPGFIPRNSGEEMLAFFVRMTEGGIAQEFGARAVGGGNVYRRIAKKVADDLPLTPDELKVFDKEQLLSTVRPIAWMGRRIGWSTPEHQLLTRYTEFIRGSLETGLGFNLPENTPDFMRAIMLGRGNSIRSMALSGVNPDLVKAGELWTLRHSDAVMKATSSMNASVFERAQMNPDTFTMTIPDKSGVAKETTVVLTGERARVGQNDFRYMTALHHQMGEWQNDDILRPIFAEMTTRFWPGTFEVLGKDNVVEAIQLSRSADTKSTSRVLAEIMDFKPDNMMASADMLDDALPEVAEAMRAAARSTSEDNLTIIVEEMRNQAGLAFLDVQKSGPPLEIMAEATERLEMINGLANKMEKMRPLMEGLDALPAAERSWMMSMISRDQIPGDEWGVNLDNIAAWARGETTAPKRVFYRGVPDGANLRHNADGSLTVIPTHQTHLNGSGISMSTDPLQAAGHTRGARTEGGLSPATGTILEIDGEWALGANGMTFDDLLQRSDNYRDFDPTGKTGPQLLGKPGEASTEVAFMTDQEFTIPAQYWRTQNQTEFLSLVEGASEANSPFASDVANGFQRYIAGEEIETLFPKVNTHLKRLDEMPVELRVQLESLLTENLDEWRAYYAGQFGVAPPTKPQSIIDLTDLTSSGNSDTAGMEKWLDEWLGEENFAEIYTDLERFGGNADVPFDDLLRQKLGLETVESVNPVQGKGVLKKGSGSDIHRMLDTDLTLRGQGSFDAQSANGWSEMYDDMEEWQKALSARVQSELASPKNQKWQRRSDHMLELPDGTPVARPPEDGVNRLYAPTVPDDIRHLEGLLSAPLPVQLEQEAETSLIQLQNLLDNPSTENANLQLYATVKHLSTQVIEGLPAGSHPMAREAAALVELIDNGRGNQITMNALRSGENIVYDKRIIDRAEAIIRKSTRQQRWDDIAKKLVASPRSVKYSDDAIRALSEDEQIEILARALRLIESNKANYSQPVAQGLEEMAFDNPSMARWLSSMLNEGPIDDAMSARVAQIDVPSASVRGEGQFESGVRLASGDNGAGRFWQLDGRYRGSSIPADGRNSRWLGNRPDVGAERTVENGNWVIGATSDQALEAWSKTIAQNLVTVQRRGVHERQIIRETLEGQNIARRMGNSHEVLVPGQEVGAGEQVYMVTPNGKLGDPIPVGDNRFFDHELLDPEDDLLWIGLGPMVRDHYEYENGLARFADRDFIRKKFSSERGAIALGEELDSLSPVRMTRSRLEDLIGQDGLPNVAFAQTVVDHPDLIWDKIVRFGFNKVIGPAMDSLSRKPMSFHYFAQAYTQGRLSSHWLLDAELFTKRFPEEFAQILRVFDGEASVSPELMHSARQVAKSMFDTDLTGASDDVVRQWLISLARDSDEFREVLRAGAASQRGRAVVRLRPARAEIDPAPAKALVDDVVEAGTKPKARPPVQRRPLDEEVTVVPNIEQTVPTERGELVDAIRIDGTPEAALADQADLLAAEINYDMLGMGVQKQGIGGTSSERLVELYHDLVPDKLWDDGVLGVKKFLKDEAPGVYSDFTGEQWRVLHASRNNLKHTLSTIEENATMTAMDNVIPFLDSHEQRSMFAEYGRNFLPFWYAEENFIKRWTLTFATSPILGADQLRKAQLAYMGIRSASVIRTDVNGKDWVVYPGSGLLVEAIGKIPGFENQPIGVLFQAGTDSLLPGISPELGAASISPFVAMPVHVVAHMFPDSKGVKRALLGDIGSQRGIVSQFVPGVALNMWNAAFSDETSSAKFGSALNAAIAFSEANDQGLEEGATAADLDEYLDKMRNHARVIMFGQALTGFVAPGAPSAITTGENPFSFSGATGVGVTDQKQIVSDLYRTYIQGLGPNEGTQAFLAAFPYADLEDVVSPMAFTTSSSESPSRAPLPATRSGMAWYQDNQEWIDSSPEAGAWFLPPDEESEDFDYYSYTQQLISGLRKKRTPLDYIQALKYRQGADVYFREKEKVTEAKANLGDNSGDTSRIIDERWNEWKTVYLTAHPLFAEQLQTGDARVRRARTIEQMRYAVSDPAAPDSPHIEGIGLLVKQFDDYRAALKILNQSRTADSEAKKVQLKVNFSDWISRWELTYPSLQRLWSSVYEPEANL